MFTRNSRNGTTEKLKLNPRRYVWIVIGFYLFSSYVKASNATSYNASSNSSIPRNTEEEGGHHGIKIFQVDWGNVSDITTVTLWIFCAMLAKIAFHITPKLGHIFPESCLLIVVGIFIGVIIHTTDAVTDNELPPRTFLFFMIPPIMLDAGYFMPNRLFFGNLGIILLFAVVGTLWNAFTIGFSLYGLNVAGVFGMDIGILELLLFSTLISAVDPVAVIAVFEEIHVNDILYIVVFGESLLNDAVTIVLYHMFEEYAVMGKDNVTESEILKGVASFPVVALGGTIVGIIYGFMTGFLTKFTYRVLAIEPIFIFVLAYLSYLNAELFHMSGVLAITFCGIIMKKYVDANISSNSNITVKYAVKTLSSMSETVIFIFLGVSTVSDRHVWNTWFVLATIGFCTIYRFLGVLWMTALVNRFRLNKINMVDQFVMSYGGLRGAVSFALALLIQEDAVSSKEIRRMFVTTTIAVVFFTVFIQGITIRPLVQWLNVERSVKKELNMIQRLQDRLMDHTVNAMETITGSLGQNKLRDFIKEFDHTYIMPYLIRDYKGSAHTKILETYSKLEIRDAVEAAQNRRPTGTWSVNSGKRSPVEDAEDGTIIEVEVIKMPEVVKKESFVDFNNDDVFLPSPRKQRNTSFSRHSLGINDFVVEPINTSYNQVVQSRPRRKFGVTNLLGNSPEGYFNRAFELDNNITGPEVKGNLAFRKISNNSTGSIERTPSNSVPASPSSRLMPPSISVSISTPTTIVEESHSHADSDVL